MSQLTTPVSPPAADPPPRESAATPQKKRVGVTIVLGSAALVALALGLYLRAVLHTNHVALSAAPRLVTVERAQSAPYRPSRTYIGSLDPWATAKIGPQYVSAYIATVLVRPGDVLKAGQILATLDCRSSSAASKAVAASAKSIAERQQALAHQVGRMREMLAGGFASPNEVEQMTARSSAETSDLESLRASLSGKILEVDDCIQRAPFDGEVAERLADPGAYVRPGNAVITVLDRSTIRVAASAPESDFNIVAIGTPVDINVEAIGQKLSYPISRRAPGADTVSRTVDFEIDVPNQNHALPANAIATLTINVGKPQPSCRVPSVSARLRGDKATVFVVQDGVAHHRNVSVLGETEGQLYVNPADLPAGTLVVTEGRALLTDGDRVSAKEVTP